MGKKKNISQNRQPLDSISSGIQIQSIQVISDILVCLEHKPVKQPDQPNWSHLMQPGDIEDGMGAKRPGVFRLLNKVDDLDKEDQVIREYYEKHFHLNKLLEITRNLGDYTQYSEIDSFFKSEETEKKEIHGLLGSQPDSPTDSRCQEGSMKRLKLEINLNEEIPQGNYFLLGVLMDVAFSAELPTGSKGSQTLELEALLEPVTFKRIWGDMKWYVLTIQNNAITGCQYLQGQDARMEIYWIFDNPGTMFTKGVWAEVLRLLAMECTGLMKLEYILQRVTNYCHSSISFRYDCYRFASYYIDGIPGWTFNLGAYLAKTFPFVNCFDQAGAVQTLLEAIGIRTLYIFMEPFGFLQPTHLVGRGWCNNPGFLAENEPEITPSNSLQRKGFGSHTFCMVKIGGYDIVLDACAGPHYGFYVRKSFEAGYKQTFLDTSIDGLTSLYDQVDYLKEPGRLKDMNSKGQQVIDVHAVMSLPLTSNLELSVLQKKKLEAFTTSFNFNSLGKNILENEAKTGILWDWPNPLKHTDLGKFTWDQEYCDIRPGLEIAAKQWSFCNRDNSSVNIEIYVANTHMHAQDRLLALALSNNHPTMHLKRKPDPLHTGHLHLYCEFPYYNVESWWFYNVFINIVAFNLPLPVDSLVAQLQEGILNHLQPDFLKYLPVIHHFKIYSSPSVIYPGTVPVGDTVTLEIHSASDATDSANPLAPVYFLTGDSVCFLKEETVIPGPGAEENNSQSFAVTFKALKSGCTTVRFGLLDTVTLLTSTPYHVAINVTPNK